MSTDPTNPAHYTRLSPEPLDVITKWGLGFCLGNVVKYIARAGFKGDALEDLRKARVYLDREIAWREGTARTEAGLAELRNAPIEQPPRHWLAEHDAGDAE